MKRLPVSKPEPFHPKTIGGSYFFLPTGTGQRGPFFLLPTETGQLDEFLSPNFYFLHRKQRRSGRDRTTMGDVYVCACAS